MSQIAISKRGGVIVANAKKVNIDGRPSFAKRSIYDGKQVKIAAIDPDFKSRPQPWSLMEYAGRFLIITTSFFAPVQKKI